MFEQCIKLYQKVLIIHLCTELDVARTVSYIECTLRTNIHRHISYVHVASCLYFTVFDQIINIKCCMYSIVQYTHVAYILTPDTTNIHVLIVVGKKF